MEDKEAIVMRLKLLLMVTRAGSDIADLKLEIDEKGMIDGGEYCVIVFKSGYRKKVDITADSGLAVIEDVIHALY